jgi:hypothetical protein
MDSQFSAAGSKKRERMQQRLKELKGELDSQRSISNDNPSYISNRAEKSVKYYTELINNADTILQEKIQNLQEEADKYKKSLQKRLEEVQDTLQREKSKTPARIVSAEHRYKRALEEYIKLGFETEKEKLVRESSESQFTNLKPSPVIPPTHITLPPTPCVLGVSLASPSNFVKPDLEIPLTKPISRTIELSETISKPLPPDFNTIGEDDDLLSLRKLHNPNSKAFITTSTPKNLLESRPLSRPVITPQIPLTQDSDDEPTQEQIDEAARKVRESYKKPNPQIPLTQMVRLSSSGKPMKSVKVALAR